MHQPFLREAIKLAIENVGRAHGGPFGAVVACGGEIVGRGCNRVTDPDEPDPTAHAEIVAIRDACRRLGTFKLDGCELYASCEPCPMCLAAIYWARIDRVYFAALREDAVSAGFDDLRILEEITLAAEARSLVAMQDLREEALAAFRAWAEKSDRIPY